MFVAKTRWFFRQEVTRLVKYKIIQISFLLALMWCGILWLVGSEGAQTFLPLFLFIDASVMSLMMIGAILFYERQENTLKPLLVTPISVTHVIVIRLLLGVLIALQSMLILGLFSRFVLDVQIALWWWVFVVSVIAFAHSVIGFSLTLKVKDFNALLMSIVFFMFVFGFPTIFFALGVISDTFEPFLFLSPTHGAFILIEHGMTQAVSLWQLVLALTYLLVVSVGLLKFWIIPNYALLGVKE